MPRLIDPLLAPGTLNSKPQPVLQAGDLTLRSWQASDAPMLAAAYEEPAIRRWHVRSMDEDEARAWIDGRNQMWQDEKGASFAIEVDGEPVGRMEMRDEHLGEGVAEIAYWLLSEYRGRGITPRALQAVTAWGFELGMHRLYLKHSVDNPQSCRVATKCHYEYEGTLRSEVRHADGWHDMHMHAAINGTWTA